MFGLEFVAWVLAIGCGLVVLGLQLLDDDGSDDE